MSSQQFPPQIPQPVPPQAPGVYVYYPQAQVHSNPNKVVSSKGWYITKIVLGCASILTALTIIGVGAGLMGSFPISSAFIDIAFAFPPAVIAIVWQKAEFITLCVRRDRGIHPGAHVGVHLVIWLASAVLDGFLTTSVASDASTSYWGGQSDCCSEDETIGYPLYLSLEEALVSLLWLLMIIHFLLFVRACVECHRRNTNQIRQGRTVGSTRNGLDAQKTNWAP